MVVVNSIVLFVFFLFTFPVYSMEDESRLPIAIPGESESHFMFRTGVFFLMTKNLPDSAAIYLYIAKEAGDLTNYVNDSINYFLTECYLALGNLEAALETNLSISDNSGFNVKTLFQRYQIFSAYGMDEEASDIIQLIFVLYPDSEEAASLQSAVQAQQKLSDELNFLQLGMFLSINEKKAPRNYETGSMSDVNPPNFGEFGPQEWKSSIKTSFLLSFNISSSHSIHLRPSIKLSAPTQSFKKDRYHYLALDINYLVAPSEDKFHELTFTCTDRIQNGAIPSYEFSLGWAFTHVGKNLKAFSNSMDATFLPSSDKRDKKGYYFSVLLSQIPLLSLGSRSGLNGWFLGMYSSLESLRSNVPVFRVYGNGAVHGDKIGSSVLYFDSTFTDSVEMMDDINMVYKKAHRLDGRVLGERIPVRSVTGTLGLDFTFSVLKWLSLFLKGQYETSFYIDTYRFDNTNNGRLNTKKTKSGEFYLFLNKSDHQEYLIYEQPKDDASDLEVYRFKKYERVKKRRWDTLFMIRPGIDLKPVHWLIIDIYTGFSWNKISFIGDGKHDYTSYDFLPGFECSFRF